MNNLKAKVEDLDVAKLKTIPVDLKKLSDVVGNEVDKDTKLNTLKTKVNNLDTKESSWYDCSSSHQSIQHR